MNADHTDVTHVRIAHISTTHIVTCVLITQSTYVCVFIGEL